jgi:hypothetical protein
MGNLARGESNDGNLRVFATQMTLRFRSAKDCCLRTVVQGMQLASALCRFACGYRLGTTEEEKKDGVPTSHKGSVEGLFQPVNS